MSDPPLPKDSKHFFHPETEQEIVDLVKYAYDHNLQLRVRGSGHSFAHNIYTDVCTLDRVDVEASAPDNNYINVKLDGYRNILSIDKSLNHVTVQAGIHLGHDPMDPLSTPENSLLYQLHYDYGLTLNDLGGISYQTVSGFLTTGSSGGSIQQSIEDNIYSLRFVDGTGNIFEVSRSDSDRDQFQAALVSLGVLGVLSQVTFVCCKTFNIKGVQGSAPVNKCHVDIYSDHPTDPERVGLTSFLTDKTYARIMWWPQTVKLPELDNEIVQVWEADKLPPSEDFKRKPFRLFPDPETMMLYSFLMTLMGNIDDMDKVRQILSERELKFQFNKLMKADLHDKHGLDKKQAERLTELIQMINQMMIKIITDMGDKIPTVFRKEILPIFSAAVVHFFASFDNNTPFQDYAFLGIPMDDNSNDIITPTMFTEIWIPLDFATQATKALRKHFQGIGRYSRTGNNYWELYAAKASSAWMGMSYTNGNDVWKKGAFRIDILWFINNDGNYLDLYRPVWILMHDEKIPFRLHWGKIFPSINDTEYNWREIIVKSQYPHFSQFLALRKQKDPKGIFLSSFWRYWLGLEQ